MLGRVLRTYLRARVKYLSLSIACFLVAALLPSLPVLTTFSPSMFSVPTFLIKQWSSKGTSRKMAGPAAYSPVDRRSMSGDDAGQTLLSHEEKSFILSSARSQRRYNLVLKSGLFLLVLILHSGLVVLLARWLASSTLPTPGSTPHQGHGDGSCGMEPKPKIRYTFEGVVPAVYKDPHAEFEMKDPCGRSAAEARARGCRYGMLYGAWLPEQCYDEETEANFKKYADWRFFLQPNRTQELSWDEVAKGEHEFVLVEWQCKSPRPSTLPTSNVGSN